MRKNGRHIYLIACSIFTTASASFALLFKCDTFSLSITMASPLASLFSAGISSAFTPFTVLMMVTFMKFAFDAEDVAIDAVNAFGLFAVGAVSSSGDVDDVFVVSVIVVVTTLSASKFNFVVSKFNFVVSKFNFVNGDATTVATVVFVVGVVANDESTAILSCLSLLSSLRLAFDVTLSFFSLPPSIDVMLK